MKKVTLLQALDLVVPDLQSPSLSIEAIKKTGNEHTSKLLEPISWFVYSRNCPYATYQINIVSDSATKLLDITGEFLSDLVLNYDELKQKNL